MMACDWQVVTRRKGAARRGAQERPGGSDSSPLTERKVDTRRITDAMRELRAEAFWTQWRDLVSEQASGVRHCVCYGLGNFSSSASARYQLAMLLLLLETLQIPPTSCSAYDPVFSRSERAALTELGLTVLPENEEGKRAASRPTLFYLMHCGKALYNNLLWRNWSPEVLPQITIIGNSFLGIGERTLQKDLERDYSFLSDVRRVCEETPLTCSPRFLDVFNDTALIRFPAPRVRETSQLLWRNPVEPTYLHCPELEIIRSGR